MTPPPRPVSLHLSLTFLIKVREVSGILKCFDEKSIVGPYISF